MGPESAGTLRPHGEPFCVALSCRRGNFTRRGGGGGKAHHQPFNPPDHYPPQRPHSSSRSTPIVVSVAANYISSKRLGGYLKLSSDLTFRYVHHKVLPPGGKFILNLTTQPKEAIGLNDVNLFLAVNYRLVAGKIF